ncbi:MAG: cytochrome c biogenesis protein CcsA [Leptospiraceae bacterium]|nr:cytochrome c biogenesis protein CcsA [Leptospiraceae bacterium]
MKDIKISKLDLIIYPIFLILFPLAVLISLNYPNVILEQGTAHRIFYFHVSVAWVALYAPFFASLFGIFYLWKRDLKFDLLSYSMSKLSLIFAICVLFSGPIWANSAWGVLWDETDARLQSFLILIVSLLSYFVLRFLNSNIQKRAMVSSFMTLFCSINSILTWGAIRWIDNPGNHPGSVLGKSGMDKDMKETFWINIIAYHLLFLLLFLILHRHSIIEVILEKVRQEE